MSLLDGYINKAKSNASKKHSEKCDDKNVKYNPHEGHRKRMKERFLHDPNLQTFAPHEILELFLFNAVPRKDTNGWAHRLIKEFDSFENFSRIMLHSLSNVKLLEIIICFSSLIDFIKFDVLRGIFEDVISFIDD